MTRLDIAAIRKRCEDYGSATRIDVQSAKGKIFYTHAFTDMETLLDYIAELEAELKVHKEAVRRQAHISVQHEAEISRLHAAFKAAQNTAETIQSLEGQKGNW